MNNVRWFFRWAERLESGNSDLPDFRAWLREFLDPQQLFVIEQRYGLTDPLFRPHMRRCTLREIGERRQVTRERMRQVEETALLALRSHLARAVAVHQEIYWVERIAACGGVIPFTDLSTWMEDARLGGYQPWGVLLLLSEALAPITCHHDYFTTVPGPALVQIEDRILQFLDDAEEPVALEMILAHVEELLPSVSTSRKDLLVKLLDHHPQISGTSNHDYFLPKYAAPRILGEILRTQTEPLHFHELTRLYNDRMLPRSQKGTGYILLLLNNAPNVRRVSRGRYAVKS
ncbi:MAG TPA: sigma factor-like helix-turn-helix DNA-binding protein [Verrucomicrobiae bacterium]|nr:sigma factor-like helix-turn-helix DNA-binding protein [Verrucomicrobiae bacterium]